MIFAAFQHPFGAQTADLGTKAAALHKQVVGQLLPVKRDGKAGGTGILGLCRQIGQQLFPCGAPCGNAEAPVKSQVFLRHDLHQVEDQLPVKSAGVFAGVQDASAVQYHHRAVFRRRHVQRKGGEPCAGKAFAKQLAWARLSQNTAVAEIIRLLDTYRACQYKADIPGIVTFGPQKLLLFDRTKPGIQTVQHGKDLCRGDAVKQRSGLQNRKKFFHKMLRLLNFQHTFRCHYTTIHTEQQGGIENET